MNDEIIAELWAIKDRIAQEHGYSVDSLAAYLQGKSASRRGAAEAAVREGVKPIRRSR